MNDCIQKLEATGDYRIIKRFKPVSSYLQDNDANKKIGIFLDTETTGLDSDSDRIIELAMVPFEFDANGHIYRLLPEYNSLNDPGKPIPAIVTQLTGITDEMVKGQSINLVSVKNLLADAVIVIAHSARFDRPFCENLLDEFKDISWGCSVADINWQEEGMEGRKLEYLASYRYGFFLKGIAPQLIVRLGSKSIRVPYSTPAILP